MRVAYYGDSFIEADILVADLRENMQATYGGCGVGWIDAGNDLEQYKRSIQTEFSGMDEHMVMKAQNYNVAEAGIAELLHYRRLGFGDPQSYQDIPSCGSLDQFDILFPSAQADDSKG